MARAESAGLLMYRRTNGELELFLAHPGGPYFRNRDDGGWTIPKGLTEPGEDLLDAARREFDEETGIRPTGEMLPLGRIRQKGGKAVHAWAFEGDWDPEQQPLVSNHFELEWPPNSGRMQSFPEVDRAAFFDVETARRKLLASQAPLIDRLLEKLEERS